MTKRRCSTNGPTIALVGKLGSGKTSILRLVEYYLNHANELKALTSTSTIGRQRIDRYRIHLCRVSNWGFSSTDAGLYHIAECILDTIKQEVDCLAIRGIPRQLASAFTGLGGWAQSLVGLLTHRSSAEAVLRRLSDVLVCTKTRVIVCIEDFERCAPSSNDANHYAALFDRIGRTPGLGLILTDIIRVAGDEGTPYPVDYLRLCRIIESIRDLNAGDVWSVITMFREYALADIRDPGADHRKEWPSTDNLNLRQKIVETIADAITSAVTGPRTLKLALRETHLAWQRLGGEIDFDDLLISNIIRAGLPGVWKYVLSNADELQSKKRQESSQETRARDSRRPKEFQRSCDAAGITLRLGELLVQELFPSFSVTNSGSYDHSVSKPQGVAVQSQVDYWERLLSGEIGSGDIRDQDVLGEIEYWQGAGENAKLPSLFVSSAEFRSRIIHFSAEVMPDRVLDLVGACLAYHRRYLNTCDNPGGLIAAGIDLTERARVPVDELRTWFKREVSMAFDVSLLFAWWFVTHVRDQQVCLHLPDEIRDSTFVEFLREFARRTSNSVEEFLRLMRGRDQYLLRYIVFSEKPPGAPLSELKHWNSFATTWLNAMESDPAIMSEPVVELLADHVGDFRDDDPETGRPKLRREFKLNEKVVHDLFDDNPRLWRWLANLDESLVEDRCMRKFAIRLREKAREKVQQTSSTE